MNNIQLSPAPGSGSLASTVLFQSANPTVAEGDSCYLLLVNVAANLPGFAFEMPGDPGFTYYGPVSEGAILDIPFTAKQAFTIGPSSPVYLATTGISPNGYVEFMGDNAAPYYPAGPPPPAPTPGIPYYASLVIASQQTGGAQVPSIFPQTNNLNLTTVPFAWQEAGASGTGVIGWPVAASLNAADFIANAMGGTVVQVAPPPPYSNPTIQPPVTVYGVELTLNGVLSQAAAGVIMQAQTSLPPNPTVASMTAAIEAVFSPVG